MAWHSVKDACQMAQKSRRTLYRDMARGLLSYGVDDSDKRVIETSELIRAYGELAQVARPESEKMAHGGTDDGTPKLAHTDPQIVALVAQVEQMNQQVVEMRAELQEYQRLLTHQPDSEPSSPPKRTFLQRLRYLFDPNA
ncbi:hypothetical protein [Larsenimonas rhizosphaerae]|uniref:hypothetical protein n=1 Tax=Larsenimonas rhizosphaerae TaxID=2944682 RepID=UPI002034767C|nr:hypothetical protein [Larsenimonas rhizosphaerae]MCM2132237.1 hypothetical protein [Larsenimonas rhizosphaerae]